MSNKKRNYQKDLDEHLKKKSFDGEASNQVSRIVKKIILEGCNFYIYSSAITMLHRPQNRNLLLDSTRAHFSSRHLFKFLMGSFYASKHYIYHCTKVNKKNKDKYDIYSVESDVLFHKSCVIQHICELIRDYELYITGRNLKHYRMKGEYIEERAEKIVERTSIGLNKIAYMPTYLTFSNKVTIENTEHNLEILNEALYILEHEINMLPESYVLKISLNRLAFVLKETRTIIECRKKVH